MGKLFEFFKIVCTHFDDFRSGEKLLKGGYSSREDTSLGNTVYVAVLESISAKSFFVSSQVGYYTQEKNLPYAALLHYSSKQYYDSPEHLFISEKVPCPVYLFHTVQLLDSPEYLVD